MNTVWTYYLRNGGHVQEHETVKKLEFLEVRMSAPSYKGSTPAEVQAKDEAKRSELKAELTNIAAAIENMQSLALANWSL